MATVKRTINASIDRVWSPLASVSEGQTIFPMTETYSGILAGMITTSIPDVSENFAFYADALQQAAEAE